MASMLPQSHAIERRSVKGAPSEAGQSGLLACSPLCFLVVVALALSLLFKLTFRLSRLGTEMRPSTFLSLVALSLTGFVAAAPTPIPAPGAIALSESDATLEARGMTKAQKEAKVSFSCSSAPKSFEC